MTTPPERSKCRIDVSSLNAAYQEMQKRDLAVVAPNSCLTSHAKEWYQMRVPLGQEETSWDLVKVAKKRMFSCMKDGINDDRISLEGPISTIRGMASTPCKVPNSAKTKRRKKMTAAKFVQLQDSRLFYVEKKKPKVKRGADLDDPEEIGAWWSMVEQKEKRKQKKREKKRKSKTRGEKKKQRQGKSKTRGTSTVEPKRGSKKYVHLQKFIETRRKKKLEKRCTLDLAAEVTLPIAILWG